MRIRAHILISMTCLLCIGGCYTILQQSRTPVQALPVDEKPPLVRRDLDYSVVEGIVSYYGTGNTRETYYPPGFILTDRHWILNPPPEHRSVMYLVGKVDRSLMHKH